MSFTDPDGTLHETYTALVEVGGAPLGTFAYDSGRMDLGWERRGTAYFCPECGGVWGRITARNEAAEIQAYQVLSVSCAAHFDRWNLAGSLLVGPLAALLAGLPEAAVRRELELHLNAAEKELEI